MEKYHETHLRLPAVLYILFKLLEKLHTSAKYRTNGAFCTVQYVSAGIQCSEYTVRTVSPLLSDEYFAKPWSMCRLKIRNNMGFIDTLTLTSIDVKWEK
jgi:hypothetical protein